jgi:DNA polymerase sigma
MIRFSFVKFFCYKFSDNIKPENEEIMKKMIFIKKIFRKWKLFLVRSFDCFEENRFIFKNVFFKETTIKDKIFSLMIG